MSIAVTRYASYFHLKKACKGFFERGNFPRKLPHKANRIQQLKKPYQAFLSPNL